MINHINKRGREFHKNMSCSIIHELFLSDPLNMEDKLNPE